MKTGVIVAIVAVIIIVAAAGVFLVMNNNNSGGSTEYTVTLSADNGSITPTSLKVKSGTTWTVQTSNPTELVFSDGQKVNATANQGYNFSHWSIPKGTVTANTSIKAVFEPAEKCVITIKAGTGGSVDKTSLTVQTNVTWTSSGNKLTFSDGQTVTATATSGYTFSAWSPASGTVSHAITINATFTPATTSYTVTFKAGEGGTVDTTTYKANAGTTWTASGNVLTFSDGKKVTATANSGYTFSAWNPASGKVTSDVTINATFAPATISYTVTFKAGEGGTIDTTTYKANAGTTWSSSGNILTFSDGKKVTATASSGYTFSSWNPASGKVSSDVTITATFSKSTGNTVSFYFTDNFDNDGFVYSGDVYPSDACAVIPGVWVKGSGSTMEAALKDACKNFGISITVTSGKIASMNNVVDGNLYLWGWNDSSWFCKNSGGELLQLSDLSVTETTYVAVVHGAKTTSGDAPAVKTTPSKISWYYGDTIEPGSGKLVTFYVDNNFIYTHFVSKRTDASDYHTLLVQGLWVRGYADYGSFVGAAFENAMQRIGYDYSYEAGWIPYINDCTGGNFLQSIWDNQSRDWYKDTNAHHFSADYVDDVDYAAITYGQWGGETGYDKPPLPLQKPGQCTWAY